MKWLEKDYDDARNAIDKFDGQLFTIRNWAVTSAGALLALGFSTQRWVVPLIGVLPVLLFGYLELTYKCFHEDAMKRSREMELRIRRVLTGAPVGPDYRFGLGEAFSSPNPKRVWETLKLRRHIGTFYVGLIVALVVATCLLAATTHVSDPKARPAMPPKEPSPHVGES